MIARGELDKLEGPKVKAAKERMERERERSQRRRDVAKLTATSYYEERMRIRRLDEQVALLKAVDEADRNAVLRRCYHSLFMPPLRRCYHPDMQRWHKVNDTPSQWASAS